MGWRATAAWGSRHNNGPVLPLQCHSPRCLPHPVPPTPTIDSNTRLQIRNHGTAQRSTPHPDPPNKPRPAPVAFGLMSHCPHALSIPLEQQLPSLASAGLLPEQHTRSRVSTPPTPQHVPFRSTGPPQPTDRSHTCSAPTRRRRRIKEGDGARYTVTQKRI